MPGNERYPQRILGNVTEALPSILKLYQTQSFATFKLIIQEYLDVIFMRINDAS